MIDTVKIVAEIDKETFDKINSFSISKMAIDNVENQILYNITSSSLKGSWDSSLSVRAENGLKYGLLGYVLSIEGSWHKFNLGINSHMGIDNLEQIVRCFIGIVKRKYHISLPKYEKWYLLRCDIAKCFDLKNQENVKNYINSLSHCSYPKRKTKFYTDETFYISGTTTTLKIYNKQLEFKKHDLKKFKEPKQMSTWYLNNKNKIKCNFNMLDVSIDVESYLNDIQGFIRFECEIHKKKLSKLYNINKVLAKDVCYEDLEKVWCDEFMKLLKYVNKDLKVISNRKEVYDRLYNNYNSDLANKLYNFYISIKLDGYDVIRNRYIKSTFYKYLKCLKDCAIDFSQSYDINENQIVSFNPFTWEEVA